MSLWTCAICGQDNVELVCMTCAERAAMRWYCAGCGTPKPNAKPAQPCPRGCGYMVTTSRPPLVEPVADVDDLGIDVLAQRALRNQRWLDVQLVLGSIALGVALLAKIKERRRG